ncbi:unnamed protein product [Rangifer tarandus platyrhynchus]|uniref:Uncharacterized protein n=1 Tax=Rangifer tarandus platyrhynchus TaxID=3082113 RepID=A0AC59Z447_RANTA
MKVQEGQVSQTAGLTAELARPLRGAPWTSTPCRWRPGTPAQRTGRAQGPVPAWPLTCSVPSDAWGAFVPQSPQPDSAKRHSGRPGPALCSRRSPEAPWLQRPRVSTVLCGFRGRGLGLSGEALWTVGGQGEPPLNLGAGCHCRRRVCGPEAPRAPLGNGGRGGGDAPPPQSSGKERGGKCTGGAKMSTPR